MILAHSELENTFEISHRKVNVFVVEAEDKFFYYCSQLNAQTNGNEGGFCLSEDDASLAFSKCAVFVSDVLGISCNDKKVTTKLLQSLQELVNSQFVLEYSEIVEKVCGLFEILNAESDYPIEYNVDEAMQGLFKAFGIKIVEEDEILDRVVAYVKVLATFLKVRCVFFMNLKTILNSRQLEELYHEAELNEISLFLIENTQRAKLAGEVVTILDGDLCEIIL